MFTVGYNEENIKSNKSTATSIQFYNIETLVTLISPESISPHLHLQKE